MAFIVGYATEEEIEVLEERGWEVEDANNYNLVGDEPDFLIGTPGPDKRVIAIFVETSIFKIMDGPDWEKGFCSLYWSNEDGWVNYSSATHFTEQEMKKFSLPIDGKWFLPYPESKDFVIRQVRNEAD